MLMAVEIAQHNRLKPHQSTQVSNNALALNTDCLCVPVTERETGPAMESFLLLAQLMASVATERHARDMADTLFASVDYI